MRITGAVPLLALLLLSGCARPGLEPQNTLPTRAATSASPSPSPPAESTACPEGGLRFTIDRGDAAMGYREVGLHALNCGDRPVTVSGRPEVAVLGKDRDPQDIAIVPYAREPQSVHPVVLGPGQSTVAVLAWRNTYDDISKPPVSGEFLAVAAAPGGPSQVVRPPVAFDLGSTGKLQVGVWE